MALYCPDPASHHLHVPKSPPVAKPGTRLNVLLDQEFAAGNYSIRGLAARYIALGATRSYVRGRLFRYDPGYATDTEARMGPNRRTNHDHEGNRRRRRKHTRWTDSYEWPLPIQ